jgi:hypothetical protein
MRFANNNQSGVDIVDPIAQWVALLSFFLDVVFPRLLDTRLVPASELDALYSWSSRNPGEEGKCWNVGTYKGQLYT